MIRYHISIIVLILVSCIIQQYLPALIGFHDARIHVFALTFLCCAVTVRVPAMLMLAFLCGFIWDAHNAIGSHGGDPTVYTSPVEYMRFGYSIIFYAIMGVCIQGVQPLFQRGAWQLSALLTGFAIFCYLSAEYLLIVIVRGGLYFPKHVLLHISWSALFTMCLSPIIFVFLFKLAKWCNYIIRYDGLKRPRFRTSNIEQN